MKTRRSRLNAQSPNKPRLLAEKGGRIFARVRYIYVTGPRKTPEFIFIVESDKAFSKLDLLAIFYPFALLSR